MLSRFLMCHSRHKCSQAPSEKSGKGPGSVSMYFLSTITSQNFEEPIRLRNETTWNVIPSHAHKAKSANYAICHNGVICVSYICAALVSHLREIGG